MPEQTATVRAQYIDEVSRGVKKTEKVTKGAFKGMAGAAGGLSTALKGVVIAYGGMRAVQAVSSLMKESSQLFQVQEKAEQDLAAAIDGTVKNVDKSLEGFKKYASAIQKQTIHGDEAVLSLMAYGKNLGVSTEQMEDATTAAIGLAAKLRIDVKTAMQLIGRASFGQTSMLTRYGIVLREGTSDQEKFNELMNLGAGAFRLAQAEAKTYTGQLQQMANATGDLKEQIGEKIIPVQLTWNKAMLAGTVVLVKIAEAIEFVMRVNADLGKKLAGGFDQFGNDMVTTAGKIAHIETQQFLAFNALSAARKAGAKEAEEQAKARLKYLGAELKMWNNTLAAENAAEIAAENAAAKKLKKKKPDLEKMKAVGPGKGTFEGPTLDQIAESERKKAAVVQAIQFEVADARIATIEDQHEREHAMLTEQLKRDLEANQFNLDAKAALFKKFSIQVEQLNKKRDAAEKQSSFDLLKQLTENENAKREMQLQTTQSIIGNMLQLATIFKDNSKEAFVMAQALAIAQAVMNTAQAATKALTAGPVAGPIAAGVIGTLGGAQIGIIAKQSFKAAAKGANFVTNGPQMMMVGDNPGGKEKVEVTPMSSPNTHGPRGTTTLAVDMSISVEGNATPETVAAMQENRAQQLQDLRDMMDEMEFIQLGVEA